MRKFLIAVSVVLALLASLAGGPARAAAEPQIVDPELDYPPPFADLVSVELAVTEKKGISSLEVKFTLAGEISAPSRNLMYGYHFEGKVGKCDLRVGFLAYPMATEPAGLPLGSAGGECVGSAKQAGGTFKIEGNTITVPIALGDLAGVVKGATITDLRATTSPGEGLNGDDTSAAGDAATGDKPWTIG